ncbi:MAG: GNAT family N-acetyltransferase [Candidatus Bathyarchaeota archaeon]|nr:GNAT family N-acetyltransferase [Candidatus Bathyarchaeota archaeon]MDH5788345.1 GNAT family N-acetyltransferase [Candidatus Bathyarchaeota archaeon]
MKKRIIRFAKENDISQIAKMILQWSNWQRERVTAIKSAINDKNQEVLVAEMDGKTVEVLHQIFFQDILLGDWSCHVLFLLVDEKHRGKAVGSQLLGKAIADAKKKGALEMHVDTIYKEAVEFYRKQGFKDDGVMLELALED